MPPEGIAHASREHLLRFEEIVRLVRIFAARGVTKIRLTGGEPLIRNNIERLVADLAAVEGIQSIGLTTNGVLLGEQVAALKSAGLHQVNVSLDTLRPDRFLQITLRDDRARVFAGIDAALAAGFVPLKLNVVVIRGMNDDEILDFVEVTRTLPIVVRFIEYMPFAADQPHGSRYVSAAAIRRVIEEHYPLTPVPVGDSDVAVAREFSIPGFTGIIGLISPISDNFCSRCNRLRLTADGSLKSCLFHPAGANLRDPLRSGVSDTTLAGTIQRVVREKPEMHPPPEELIQMTAQTMTTIGG